MARTLEIFNRLVEEKHLVVKTGDFKSHDGLRIRLVKLFSRHKSVLEDIGFDDGTSILSVCAKFDPATGNSTFHIQRRQTNQIAREFEIVETGAPMVATSSPYDAGRNGLKEFPGD